MVEHHRLQTDTIIKCDEALGIPMGTFIDNILLDLFAGMMETGNWPAMERTSIFHYHRS